MVESHGDVSESIKVMKVLGLFRLTRLFGGQGRVCVGLKWESECTSTHRVILCDVLNVKGDTCLSMVSFWLILVHLVSFFMSDVMCLFGGCIVGVWR